MTIYMPRPALNRGPAMANRNAEGVGCQVEIGAQWQVSMHRQSESDPVYQRAFAIERMAFCQNCPSPEADPTKPVPDSLVQMSIGCASYHVDLNGNIIRGRGPPLPDAPHNVIRSTGNRQSTSMRFRPLPIHPNADCPMPRENGYRSHRLAMTTYPKVLRPSADVKVKRDGPRSIRATINAKAVGPALTYSVAWRW